MRVNTRRGGLSRPVVRESSSTSPPATGLFYQDIKGELKKRETDSMQAVGQSASQLIVQNSIYASKTINAAIDWIIISAMTSRPTSWQRSKTNAFIAAETPI